MLSLIYIDFWQHSILWRFHFSSFLQGTHAGLKILPSSHSTATWCIMVNVSMWCLPTTAHKEWCARNYYRNDKESYTFQRQTPSFYIMYTRIFHKHIN